MRRLLGLFTLFCTLLAAAGQLATRPGNTVRMPTVSWIFDVPGEIGGINLQPWLGWGLAVGFLVLAAWLLKAPRFRFTPMTARKLARFTEIGRGWWSFRILLALVGLACLDHVVVGRRALAVQSGGQWYFPAFRQEIFPASFFGQEGEGETDYRKLAEAWKSTPGKSVVLPVIPWDPTYDTDESARRPLAERDGILVDASGRPYSGLAQQSSAANPSERVRQARFRNGRAHLTDDTFGPGGVMIHSRVWEHGKLVSESAVGTPPEGYQPPSPGPWMEIDYPPIRPIAASRHYLGTDSRGWDVAAQLFGGFQVVLKASALFLLATYAIGISLGLLMGYLGGIFDLVMQRLIEILSSVPFIYLVIILVSIWDRDRIGLGFLVGILCLFSWIGCSYYMRSATYREKARDYVAAARVMGAGPGRIIFKHILPNTLSVLVTLVPFSITSISSSLTSLDFIGFGLPERYASWGRLLSDGVENLREAPWITTSVFMLLVSVLLFVTFVGEALREAFDPKKFTTYR